VNSEAVNALAQLIAAIGVIVSLFLSCGADPAKPASPLKICHRAVKLFRSAS
jgi:hypothetical protein